MRLMCLLLILQGINICVTFKTVSFNNYVTHIQFYGVTCIKKIARKMTNLLNVQTDFNKEVSDVIKDYLKQMSKYRQYVVKLFTKDTHAVEDEFLYRNMLHTAFEYLYHAQGQLLKKTTIGKNNTLKDNTDEIMYELYAENMRVEIKYLCIAYKFCKPHPPFTDYVENLIIELVKLSDEKIQSFIELLKDIVMADNNIQILIYRVQDNENGMKEARNMFGNTTLRESLLVIKAFLSQRYKINICPNKAMAVRIQAAKSFLDMIDKSFHHNNDFNLLLDYGAMINAIQAWNEEAKPLSRTDVETFVNNILRTVTETDPATKSALVEMMVRGATNYTGLEKDWFLPGFNGVFVESDMLALYLNLALEIKVDESKQQIDEKSLISYIQDLEIPEIVNTTIMLEVSRGRMLDQLQEYINHLKVKGADVILNISKQIIQDIKPKRNITQDVISVIDIYEKKIENYAAENYIELMTSKYFVDKAYMFLDVLNTAYRCLLKEQRKKFDDLAPRKKKGITYSKNVTAKFDVYKIIFEQAVKFENKEALFICHNFQICKPYSEFTHDLYSFISQAMDFEKNYFNKFLNLLNQTITSDEDFIDLINGNDETITNIYQVFDNSNDIKESMDVLRALLIHRHKVIHISNIKRKRKIQAVRIILDILEKVLCCNRMEQFIMDAGAAIAAVKKWPYASIYSTENEIADDIIEYINGIFRALSESGDIYIPYLIDTLLTSELKEADGYKDLFRDGSKNVYML